MRICSRYIWVRDSLVVALVCTVFASEVFAAKKRSKRRPTWRFSQTYSFLSTVSAGSPIEESANPDNLVYQLPSAFASSELRQEIQSNYGRRYRLVMRPRLKWEQTLQDIPDSQDQVVYDFDAYMNEAYFAARYKPNLQFVIGLQSFEWGPAELASPSNPMFRDLGLDRTVFYETRGKSLLRVNYSPSGQTSIILMAEPVENGAKPEAYETEFQRKALMKLEYADATLTDYIGLVLAIFEKDSLQQGIYLNYEIVPGFSTYVDLIARLGSRAYYPTENGDFAQSRLNSNNRELTSILGLRFVTEDGWDFRLEGFYDDNGWSLDERQLAQGVLSLNPTIQNLQIYSNPGSLLAAGQRFAYGSVIIPSFGWNNRLNFSLRSLHSLSDATTKVQMTLDTHFNDNLVGNIGGFGSFGPLDGELTQGYQWLAFISAAWTW